MKAPLLDGLVTWASSLSTFMTNSEIRTLFSSLSPLPMVDIGYMDLNNIPSIRIDNNYSIHLLVQHLVKVHKFNKIVFFGSLLSQPHIRRLECFKKEILHAGLEFNENSIYMAESLDFKDILPQIDRLCSRPLPQAILTSSDIIAAQIIEELEKRNIHVPEDIAVTGFNNQHAGLTSLCPITTIDLAYYKRGYEAVELLIDRIMGKKELTQVHMVNTSLIVRQSCGCFEDVIFDSLNQKTENYTDQIPPNLNFSNQSEVKKYISEKITVIFGDSLSQHKEKLMSAILDSLYKKQNQERDFPPLLIWFRSYLKKEHFHNIFFSPHKDPFEIHKKISALRSLLLSLLPSDYKKQQYLENVFQQIRTLYSVDELYGNISRQNEVMIMNNMANQALDLASADNKKQIENILRFKIGQLQIPGLLVCLAPYLDSKIGESRLEIVIPLLNDLPNHQFPAKIQSPEFFPKKIFHGKKNFKVSLSLLCHNSVYMGYVYFLMGKENQTTYDHITELLSQTLYKFYEKNNLIKKHGLLSNEREELAGSIKFSQIQSQLKSHSELNREAITDYLLDHIDEMTNLNTMADFFGLSKSHLARRTKELTGYSAQTLHELLKIEQAKNLIKNGSMKMIEIAQSLGFSNPNYFSNVFKKVTGQRPTEYQEKILRK